MRSTVDIRALVCPMTWVRVKLALEQLAPGEELDVLLAGDEPLRNVPRSARGEGHDILLQEARGAFHLLRLRRGAR